MFAVFTGFAVFAGFAMFAEFAGCFFIDTSSSM